MKLYIPLLGAALLAFPMGSAKAADLGGNCCADLEERVAELESTVVKKNTRGLSMTISGRVNMSVANLDVSYDLSGDAVDDDSYSENFTQVISGPGANSRVLIDGRGQINSDWEAGYRFSFEFDGQDTKTLFRDGDDSVAGTNDDIAAGEAYFFIRSATLGAVSIGTRGQSYGSAAKVDITGKLGTVANVDPSVGLDAVGTALTRHFDGDGGTSDRAGVRYDSPTIGGFILSADWVNVDADTDLVGGRLSFANQFGDFRIVAAAGIWQEQDADGGDDEEERNGLLGSAGIMHVPSGLFVNAGAGQIDHDDGTDETFHWSVNAGIQLNALAVGPTTIFGQYYDSDQLSNDDVSLTFDSVSYDLTGVSGGLSYYGFGIVQSFNAVALDLHLYYRHYDMDFSGVDASDDDAVLSGEADVLWVGGIINF